MTVLRTEIGILGLLCKLPLSYITVLKISLKLSFFQRNLHFGDFSQDSVFLSLMKR